MANKNAYIGMGIVFVVALALMMMPEATSYSALEEFDGIIEFHKSMNCGCCGAHASYLSGKGDLDVDVMIMEDVEPAKDELGVPEELRTCHTFVIRDYFVEGHVPLEAINKLIEEMPDIKGIAMPGMPAGSPGMPGVKSGDWIIYGVNHDGSFFEWFVM